MGDHVINSPCTGTACCHKSSIRNISGGSLTLSCVPNRTISLANNEEVSFDGDIRQLLLGTRRNKRLYNAFMTALNEGKIQLLHTPNAIFYDHLSGDPQMIVVSNADVDVVDACWESTSNSH